MSGHRTVVGCMTGTSIDGLDCSLVRIDGVGLDLVPRFVRHAEYSLGALAAPLRALADQHPTTAGEIARLARDFSLLHVEGIRGLLRGERADLICVHGQTVFHAPPVSWQLMQPAPIAAGVGCPVISDLRQADLAAGGQGAPLTPIADWIFFREVGRRVAVVNLGGFCNITLLPAQGGIDAIEAFDVCVCNQLLDRIARDRLGVPFDADGAHAAAGHANLVAAEDLRQVLTSAKGRSLGTGDEAAAWLGRWRTLDPRDLAATASEAIGRTIGEKVQGADRVLVAGGGIRHARLKAAIARAAGVEAEATDAAGLPAQARESAQFAVLGALAWDGVPVSLARVTGCPGSAPLAGSWTPPPGGAYARP